MGASPDKNTGVGCHFLLQGLFPTQGLNLGGSPALAGRFFISVPPGKPRTVVYHPQNNFLVLYSELFITM